MKKILALCLTFIMVLSMLTVAVSAATINVPAETLVNQSFANISGAPAGWTVTSQNGDVTYEATHIQFASSNGDVEIRNIAFVDSDGDGILKASEECKVSFEIMNRSRQPLHNVTPMVKETTGNKRVYISPSILIERIMPHRGIRYTAAVVGASKLKNGEIIIQPGVVIGDKEVIMPGSEIKITTRKR